MKKRILSVLLSVAMLTSMTTPAFAATDPDQAEDSTFAGKIRNNSTRISDVYDGTYDQWHQDTYTIMNDTTAIAPVINGGRLYLSATSDNKNNGDGSPPPAVFVDDAMTTALAGASGTSRSLSFTFEPNSAEPCFGIYLNYAENTRASTNGASGAGKGMFLGYNTPGQWFAQSYDGVQNAWNYSVANQVPLAPGSKYDIKITWNKDGSNATLKVGETTVFNNLNFSGPVTTMGQKNAIGFKMGKSNNNVVCAGYFSDIKYSNQTPHQAYSISGTVTDGDDAPLVDAAVKIGAADAVTTDTNGHYTASGFMPGYTYDVQVSKDGYETFIGTELDGIEVPEDTTADLTDVDFSIVKIPVITQTLSTDKMDAVVDMGFPRIIQYTMKNQSNKVFYGQTSILNKIVINSNKGAGGTEIIPEVSSQRNGNLVTYTMKAKNEAANIDCILTAQLEAVDNTMTFRITDVVNNLDEIAYPVESFYIPNHSMVSVRSTQQNANLKGAQMSSSTMNRGDFEWKINDSFNETDQRFLYAFISNNELSAGLTSNSEFGVKGAGSDNYRVMARVEDKGSYKSVGLESSEWYLYRKASSSDNSSNTKPIGDSISVLPPTEMPFVKIVIDGDGNGDNLIDWQDGAIAFRDTIMHLPYKSEEVPELVSYRIAMNFGSHAQNPFLKTLDNVKKISLHTDGLGQSILLKGYGSEGHDSGHPDYGDIGQRIGGAEDMNTMMEQGAEYGARFGIHVNASEMYPEAKGFTEKMVRRDDAGALKYGWNWIDQGVGINGLWDLASGSREKRFAELKQEVGDNLDFVYVDVWGNNTSGTEDAWQTRKLSQTLINNGWRVAHEWGWANEYDSTFQHWAADLTYGGYDSKGIMSEVVRFLHNTNKDSWVGDYSGYSGYAEAPLIGGYNMKDIEGWQGRSNYDAYIKNLYSHDVVTKFIQHYEVMKWEDGTTPNTMRTFKDGTWRTSQILPDKKITLQDEDGNQLVLERPNTTWEIDNTAVNQKYRERNIYLNGKLISKGAVPQGDGGSTYKGTETYLLPWVWDSVTGDKLPQDEERLYHWNNQGGSSTWDLPESWAGLSTVKMYTLTELGKTEEKTINVSNGKVTLNAKAQVPYVLYRGEAENQQMVWSVGAHVVDTSFNGGTLAPWAVNGGGGAAIVKTTASNDVLKLYGSTVELSQTITDLIPGQRYAVYVGVDNRSDSKASITVSANGKVLDSNYTVRSIAKNYVKADAHSTSNPTVDGASYFQNMYVFFEAPKDGGKVTLTLGREDGTGAAYFDDIRVVENESQNFVKDANGKVTQFTQDFETSAQGMYPFVVANIEGAEDNRQHLSQKHEPYTQAGWDVKHMDDVLDGDWSLKVNGLVKKSRMAFQTIPQNFRFEPGVTYDVQFDYQCGAGNIYGVVTTSGEGIGSVPVTLLSSSMGTTKTYKTTVTGDESGQTWLGIYSTNQEPNNYPAGWKLEANYDQVNKDPYVNLRNFGGYKDLVLDNVVITVSSSQKGELQTLVTKANTLKAADYEAAEWTPFTTALEEATKVLNNMKATQQMVDTATLTLKTTMTALKLKTAAVSGIVKDDSGNPLAGVMVTLAATTGTDTPYMAQTGSDGKYSFANVLLRAYTVKAELKGYDTAMEDVAQPAQNAAVTKDLTMQKTLPAPYSDLYESGNADYWTTLDGNSGTVTAETTTYNNSGALKLNFTNGTRHTVIYDNTAPKMTNGTVEFDITPLNDGARFGVSLRTISPTQRIHIGTYSSSSGYGYEHWFGGGGYTGEASGPALKANVTAHWKITLAGQQVTFSVNGKQIYSKNMSNAPTEAGYIGFGSEISNTVLIDNLRITSTDAPPANTHVLKGNVQTPARAADGLFGVQLVFKNADNEVIARTSTDINGDYVTQPIAYGTISGSASASGYGTKEITPIVLDAGTPAGDVTVPSLTLTVDNTQLKALYDANVNRTGTYYTEKSWAAFTAALAKAKAVLDSQSPSAADLADAYTALNNAINGLIEKNLDLRALRSAYDSYKGLKSSNYTTDSWTPFQAAMDDALVVLNNGSATLADADRALEALNTAYAGLVKTGGGNKPSGGGSSGGGGGGNSTIVVPGDTSGVPGTPTAPNPVSAATPAVPIPTSNWNGDVGPTGGALYLDTQSYAMAPNGMYDIKLQIAPGLNAKTMKVYSSRDSIAKVVLLPNGNYRITGVKPGETYFMVEIYDTNGVLMNHASVKITIAQGQTASGVSNRKVSLY